MRSKYLFKTMISGIIFAVILVLLAACSGTSSSAMERNTPTDVQEMPAAHVEAQINAGAPIPVATEPAASQVPPIQDGTALLERNCAKCHIVQWLQQIKKPRSEWEMTLAQMEGMGVHLDGNEKVSLLDFLSKAEKP